MSRLTAHQKRHGNNDENHGPPPAREEPRLPFHRSSRQQHRKPAPDPAATGDEENVANALNTSITSRSSSSSYLVKPVASTIYAAASTLSSVAPNPTTPARKPKTPAKLGGTATKISTATPQRLQQDASTMLTRLRQALARAQGESQRLSTIAQQPRLKARGAAAGAAAPPPRPSAEVLDMCRRLVAATESAVKNLQVLFPHVVVEVEEEGGREEGKEGEKMEMESEQGKALMLAAVGVTAVATGGRPSLVAEEEEEDEEGGAGEEEEEEDDEESLEEGEIREETHTPKRRASAGGFRSVAGTPAAAAAAAAAEAESEELRGLVEEVGQQLEEGEVEEEEEEEEGEDDKKAEEKEEGVREDDVATTVGAARAEAAPVDADAAPASVEVTEEENEKEEEGEEEEAAAAAAAAAAALIVEVVEEEEEEVKEEEESTRPLDPDSPPSMSDLGLSHFTRRFIEAAKEEKEAGGEGGEEGNNKTMLGGGNDPSSSFVTASPASPVLPREKSSAAAAAAAAAAAPPGTPTITMPTADGMREFPSPIFRTGVKLRHPPSEHHRRLSSSTSSASGKAAYTHASGGPSTSSSSSSSSCRSPALFEPQSVNKQGSRRSLHAPYLAPLFPSSSSSSSSPMVMGSAARQHHHERHQTSFASSSAATPAMHSPSLLQRHASTATSSSSSSNSMSSSNINRSLALIRGAGGVSASSPSYSAASARSDDPTPELTSPAKTPFRVLPLGEEGGREGGSGGGGTPTTARCIRLLQFPPLSVGGTVRGGEGGREGGRSSAGRSKSMSRTPSGAAAAATAAAAAAAGEGGREEGEDMMMMGDDESFTANYPDLTTHSSFVFSPNRMLGLGLDEDEREGGREGGPRYYLRSAEKKARELAMAKMEEEEAARRAAAARALAAARRSPRLASLSKSPGNSGMKVAAASSSSSPSILTSSTANVNTTNMSSTRKSPRIARLTLEREVGSAHEGGGGGRGGLFAAEVEAEVEEGGREEVVCRPILEVGVEEYAKTPSFIQMQVTREMLNGAIGAFNCYVGGRKGGKEGLEALPLDRVTEVIAQGDTSKTVLLSLIHLKRVEISVTAQGQKAYKIWK